MNDPLGVGGDLPEIEGSRLRDGGQTGQNNSKHAQQSHRFPRLVRIGALYPFRLLPRIRTRPPESDKKSGCRKRNQAEYGLTGGLGG